MAAVKRVSPRRRGRTTREELVATATAIVDRDGADALTIRRLAEAAGLSRMGVYRYVRSRAELLDLVVEHTLAQIPHRAAKGTWKRQAAHLFEGMRKVSLEHPGVVALGVARATPVPSMARFTERALEIMEGAGFRGQDVVLAYDALLMFTIGSILWQVPRTGTERERLVQAAVIVRQPVEHLMRHAAALADRDPDRYFTFGFNALLDGLGSMRRS